jgi:two-component system sensor histidine kinase RegB
MAAGRGPETAPPTTSSRGPASQLDHGNVNLSWLVRLHWLAIAGQVVVIAAAVAWSGVALPTQALAGLVAAEVVVNLGLAAWTRRGRVTDRGVAAVMLADVVVLTALLDLTGGVANPFTTLYLVYVALATVLLPSRWAWALAVASMSGLGVLYLSEQFLGGTHHVTLQRRLTELSVEYGRTVWVGFAVASASIVYFVRRISDALAEREQELEEARLRGVRRERLASLATLAAGAAHELATPLSTIAVVAKEMQRNLPRNTPSEVSTDLQIVRDQVARCRGILDRMSAHAGETAGEPLSEFTARIWIDAALDNFKARERVGLEAAPGALEAAVRGPPRALADTLRGLLKNAAQASEDGAPITLRLELAGDRLRTTVSDRGRGMSKEVLSRVGEPFYTTKVPGEGMGLGLFLTRALAEQLGGDFRITSRPGQGTEATMELPASAGGRRSP